MLTAAIEFGKLGQVVWVSLLAGIGVTGVFSLVIFGGAQAAEARRAGRSGAASAYGVLAVVAMIAVFAGVAFALSVILNKS